MTEDKDILVPGEVSIAIQTARPEMLKPLMRSIETGDRVLPPAEVIGIVTALGELIKLSFTNQEKARKLGEMLDDALASLDAQAEQHTKASHSVKMVARAIRNLRKGEEADAG